MCSSTSKLHASSSLSSRCVSLLARSSFLGALLSAPWMRRTRRRSSAFVTGPLHESVLPGVAPCQGSTWWAADLLPDRWGRKFDGGLGRLSLSALLPFRAPRLFVVLFPVYPLTVERFLAPRTSWSFDPGPDCSGGHSIVSFFFLASPSSSSWDFTSIAIFQVDFAYLRLSYLVAVPSVGNLRQSSGLPFSDHSVRINCP